MILKPYLFPIESLTPQDNFKSRPTFFLFAKSRPTFFLNAIEAGFNLKLHQSPRRRQLGRLHEPFQLDQRKTLRLVRGSHGSHEQTREQRQRRCRSGWGSEKSQGSYSAFDLRRGRGKIRGETCFCQCFLQRQW